MLDVATVVLRHETAAGGHFDFMVEDPAGGGRGALVTWRCAVEPRDWRAAGRVVLEALPPHRRAYLHREGRVSGGRGWVRRVDEGRAVVERWDAGAALLSLRTEQFTGRVQLRRIAAGRWFLTVIPLRAARGLQEPSPGGEI